jgi:hypothetical protein
VEELLESAEKDAQRAHGAAAALRSHINNLLQISSLVDAEIGKEVPDLETAKMIKKWLGRAIVATENAAQHQKNVELSFLGAVSGHKTTHDILQKMSKQLADAQADIEEGVRSGAVVITDGTAEAVPGARRPSGVRPAASIKAQRLAEEKTAKKKTAKKKTAKKKTAKKTVAKTPQGKR